MNFLQSNQAVLLRNFEQSDKSVRIHLLGKGRQIIGRVVVISVHESNDLDQVSIYFERAQTERQFR